MALGVVNTDASTLHVVGTRSWGWDVWKVWDRKQQLLADQDRSCCRGSSRALSVMQRGNIS